MIHYILKVICSVFKVILDLLFMENGKGVRYINANDTQSLAFII